MSKKTTKTSGGAVTKRPAAKKRPLAIAERVKRIELDVNRHGANMAKNIDAMHRTVVARHDATHAAVGRLSEQVGKLQRDLSLLLSGASFMQELEQAKPTEEQGLEPGDYTDASKEVADELTAMGYNWIDEDRARLRYIEWGSYIEHRGLMVNKNGTGLAPLSQDTMLSRARVTAKRLGLVPVEMKPWKPEVGQYVKPSPKAMDGWGLCPPESGVIERIDGSLLFVRELNGVLRNGIESWRYEPMSTEGVAAYKQQQELAKPIVPYETRVMYDEGEWRVCALPDSEGDYLLHRITVAGDSLTEYANRNDFTVIS